MPAFTIFNSRLPDPTFDVNSAGAQVTLGTGSKGPGFANISVRAKRPVELNRTISNRGIIRDQGSHIWEIDINYHPMPRSSFDVIQAFLDTRGPRFNPFYVVLPQHAAPKNTTFATTVLTNTVRNYLLQVSGKSYMDIDINNGALAFSGTTGYPSIGDYFNIDDPSDANHQKIYRITRVETTTDYNSTLGAILAGQVRIHFVPPLVREVANDSVIRFTNPTFRVVAKNDVLEYQLDTDNLYQFQLQLEEILP